MNAIDLLRRLHQHRVWVSRNLLQAAATLDEQKLLAPLAIGQGSIWKSLVHMYGAEFVWLEALLGNEDPLLPGDVPGKLPGNQLGETKIENLPELTKFWSELDERWTNYLSGLQVEVLDDIVYKTSTSVAQGQRLGTRRVDILLHVATHAHYTAAQVVNMLRQLGVDKLPPTMLISLARQEGSR